MAVYTYTEMDSASEDGLFLWKKGILRINPDIPGYMKDLPPGRYVLHMKSAQIIFQNVREIKPLLFSQRALEFSF